MHTSRRPSRRTSGAVATLAAAFALVATAGTASAHVEGQTVQAGERSTVPFLVQHGCDGAATTKVEIQVPAEATDPEPGEVDGWTGSVSGNVVTFDGGELPDDVEAEFPVTFTAPPTAMTLRFPVVQTCGDEELAWIGEDPEGDNPAPTVEVVGTATTTTAGTDDTTTTAPAGPEETTTTAPAEPTATTEAASVTGEDDEQAADDDDSSPLPIVLGVAAVVALVGGVVYARSRKGGDADTDV